MYFQGDGVSQDYPAALKWYQASAKQGNMYARHNLGWMYVQRLGVAKDPHEATKWFQLAAEDGHPGSMANLGIAYAQGIGLRQDFTLAYMWLSLALSSQPPPSTDGNVVVALRDALAQHLSESEKARAQKLIEEWNKKHNRQN
jgi:TPR repeat protein